MRKIVVFRIALLTIAALTVMPAGVAFPRLQDSKANAPTLVVRSSDDIWNRPWVFETVGTQKSALAALESTHGARQRLGPIPIRLEDGSIGTIRVEAGPCGPQASCTGPRVDCGCFYDDSYWILIVDSRGLQIKRLHFWAAYGLFQIVPLDLTGGRGDELLIFRVPTHAAPPVGYDIKIWEIGQAAPRDLANSEHVAGHLPAIKMAVSCVFWKTTFLVDPKEAKPRPLTLQIEVSVSPECPMQETTGLDVDKLQPKEPLRFNPATRKYVFPSGGIASID